MTWVVVGIAILAIALVGFAIWRLLLSVTAWGGDRLDGVDAGRQAITEANAYRGSVDADDVPMDGERRLARPRDDAGFGFFG